jgi:hypothetical protein
MMPDAAVARVQYVYRCQHPLGCTNLVSAWPYCPRHGGWSHLLAALASHPVSASSAEWAAARGEFLLPRARSMKCARCKVPGSALTEPDRRCAFDDRGRFRASNRHCSTMVELLALATDRASSAEGNHAALLEHNGSFVILAWRGAGARVAYAAVLVPMGDGDGLAIAPAVLSLDFADQVIAARSAQLGRNT